MNWEGGEGGGRGGGEDLQVAGSNPWVAAGLREGRGARICGRAGNSRFPRESLNCLVPQLYVRAEPLSPLMCRTPGLEVGVLGECARAASTTKQQSYRTASTTKYCPLHTSTAKRCTRSYPVPFDPRRYLSRDYRGCCARRNFRALIFASHLIAPCRQAAPTGKPLLSFAVHFPRVQPAPSTNLQL